MKNFKIIVFLGVDGSGKSTLINSIVKKNKLKFEKIHFTPDYFRNKKVQTVNPHLKKKRGKLFSFLKLIYWIINYKLFEIVNYKSHKIFFFDRYLSDIIIDPLRYRFSLPAKITNQVIKFMLKPDLIILLRGSPHEIYSRKQELKLKEIIKLNNKYIKFIKKYDNKLILDCSDKIYSNRNKVLSYIKRLTI